MARWTSSFELEGEECPAPAWVGSGAFVFAVLVALALGGGVLLSILPFNSAEQRATAARTFREVRDFPVQEVRVAATESTPDLMAGTVSMLSMVLAPAQIRAASMLQIFPEPLGALPVDSVAAISRTEDMGESAAFDATPLLPGGDSLSPAIPPANNGSAAAFEAIENAAVPEPATWVLIGCGTLGLVLTRRFGLKARR